MNNGDGEWASRVRRSCSGERLLFWEASAASCTHSIAECAIEWATRRNIGRQQAARLAAILPAPLKRRPERMNRYSAIILERMAQLGW